MSYDERGKTVSRPHNLSLEDRKKLTLSGIEDVDSFDENEIVAVTPGGCLVIKGEGLNIGKLDLVSGEVSVQGLIKELCYEEVAPSGSLWSRLFH